MINCQYLLGPTAVECNGWKVLYPRKYFLKYSILQTLKGKGEGEVVVKEKLTITTTNCTQGKKVLYGIYDRDLFDFSL